jgi:hypothetical protein
MVKYQVAKKNIHIFLLRLNAYIFLLETSFEGETKLHIRLRFCFVRYLLATLYLAFLYKVSSSIRTTKLR